MTINVSALGGGSGQSLIGETKSLNVRDQIIHTDPAGNVYLRSGIMDTDIASYPEAFASPAEYSGVLSTIDTSGEISTNQIGMTNDGSNFYITSGSGTVYEYTLAGSFTGTITIDSGYGNAGIAFYENNLWAANSSLQIVKEYDTSGTATGRQISTAAVDQIAIKNDLIYTFNDTGSNVGMRVYNFSGGLVQAFILIGASGAFGVTILSDHILINETGSINSFYPYPSAASEFDGSIDLQKVGFQFNTGVSQYRPITNIGDTLYYYNQVTYALDEYEILNYGVGLRDSVSDSSSGLPIYVRIR